MLESFKMLLSLILKISNDLRSPPKINISEIVLIPYDSSSPTVGEPRVSDQGI